jgi:hypothetical protein
MLRAMADARAATSAQHGYTEHLEDALVISLQGNSECEGLGVRNWLLSGRPTACTSLWTWPEEGRGVRVPHCEASICCSIELFDADEQRRAATAGGYQAGDEIDRDQCANLQDGGSLHSAAKEQEML